MTGIVAIGAVLLTAALLGVIAGFARGQDRAHQFGAVPAGAVALVVVVLGNLLLVLSSSTPVGILGIILMIGGLAFFAVSRLR